MVGLLAWFAGSGLASYLRGEFMFSQGIDRAVGESSIVGGPNELAGVLLALLPFLIALVKISQKSLVRLLLVGCGGLALATMVATGSRAGMLGLAAVGLYYVLRSRHKVISLIVCVMLACVIWLAMPQQYQTRYLTTVHFAEGQQLDASNEARLAIWRAGARMFGDHFLLGVGAGQFPTAFGTMYSGVRHGAWWNPHNLLLQVACELGSVGLLVFVYFVAKIIAANLWILRQKAQGPLALHNEVAVACGALLVGLLVGSAFSHTLYRPYWYLLGGLVAANRSLLESADQDSSGVVRADASSEECETTAIADLFVQGRKII
jgi:O-antigen ligase